ncbi:hypothetical protein PF003_g33012 [Phytophthora fragariae]|nr:hypothetical protein PF003_g33012 [Phytophthora fragariae]
MATKQSRVSCSRSPVILVAGLTTMNFNTVVEGRRQSLLLDDAQAKTSYFKEAAVELDYIHSQKVVPGDLKCNNILIGGDDKAKSCECGFSCIRSQSVGLSKKAQTDTVRWKAPECLMPIGDTADAPTNPRFASDIYSFGMCMIEAFSDEPPYALDDDDTILEKVFSGEGYPRSDGFADDEWALKRLTDPDWEQRISLSSAITELKLFAEREELRNSVNKTDRVCPGCSAMVGVEFSFCEACGHRVDNIVAASA